MRPDSLEAICIKIVYYVQISILKHSSFIWPWLGCLTSQFSSSIIEKYFYRVILRVKGNSFGIMHNAY